eukprot:4971919-Pyramimonas_sp.AAC.1
MTIATNTKITTTTLYITTQTTTTTTTTTTKAIRGYVAGQSVRPYLQRWRWNSGGHGVCGDVQ